MFFLTLVSVIMVINKVDSNFISRIKDEWESNTFFWLNTELYHINEIKDEVVEIISSELNINKNILGPTSILDVGCGEGWIAREFSSARDIEYLGIDYNNGFVTHLNKKYHSLNNIAFKHLDITDELNFEKKFDIVVNCFNFFELDRLSEAMSNSFNALRKGGSLVIITIEPVLQILAASKEATFDEFRRNLELYAKYRSTGCYEKEIEAQNNDGKRKYYGVLYSTADYVSMGLELGFVVKGMRDIVRTDRIVPKIYKSIVLRKP